VPRELLTDTMQSIPFSDVSGVFWRGVTRHVVMPDRTRLEAVNCVSGNSCE
jgi:hypothetical protein